MDDEDEILEVTYDYLKAGGVDLSNLSRVISAIEADMPGTTKENITSAIIALAEAVGDTLSDDEQLELDIGRYLLEVGHHQDGCYVFDDWSTFISAFLTVGTKVNARPRHVRAVIQDWYGKKLLTSTLRDHPLGKRKIYCLPLSVARRKVAELERLSI